MGPIADIVALQRQAGNEATSALLREPVATGTGGVAVQRAHAVPELLDDADVRRAEAFYRAQPERYTAAVMNDLHTKVGLPASSEPTPGLVKLVAVMQKQQGLKVDGMAGPRTLPVLFPSGLQDVARAEEFAGEASDVTREWDTSPLPGFRANVIVGKVNGELIKAGVPACNPGVKDLGGSVLGEFEHSSWTIFMDEDLVRGPSIDPVTHKNRLTPAMADAYHEARHAEQWFAITRMLAGRQPTPSVDALALRAQVPRSIAEKALAAPIAPGTMEAAIAEGWFDAELGSDRVKTEHAREQADAAETAAEAAEKRARDDPTEANKALAAAARKRADALLAIYKDVPTEGDAFRAEKKFEDELASP